MERRERILDRIAHWERVEERARAECDKGIREAARIMQDYLHELLKQDD